MGFGFWKIAEVSKFNMVSSNFTTIFINDFPKLREPASYIADNLKNLPKCWQKIKISHVYPAILKKLIVFAE